jgi:ribonuclease Z
MFELVFLGTAAAVPSTERGSPALLVVRGPARFLVDCGEGTQRQLMRAGLGFRGLGHVLLTHLHLDHVAGLAGLLATRQLYQLEGSIEIIGSHETIAFVRRYLCAAIGPEREAGYRFRAVSPALYYLGRGGRSPPFRWRIAAPRALVTCSKRKPAERCFQSD